ncbi:hypothetical protein T09_10083 [Trichinella sp. T9]|nr:hypothetical protein T09_10083 [Trichinella sp. T9]
MFSVTPSGVETEKELKHSFQVVSRWKAVYNEIPVEFIPREGKTRQSIPLLLEHEFGENKLALHFYTAPSDLLWVACNKALTEVNDK